MKGEYIWQVAIKYRIQMICTYTEKSLLFIVAVKVVNNFTSMF